MKLQQNHKNIKFTNPNISGFASTKIMIKQKFGAEIGSDICIN